MIIEEPLKQPFVLHLLYDEYIRDDIGVYLWSN